MAAQQAERHKIGRKGETVARKLIGGKKTTHKAPFDVVDFSQGYAYEVKTMSGWTVDKKIHISDVSMARKLEWAAEYELKPLLIAVVIYSPTKVEVYQSELKQCIRINQMTRMEMD